MSFGLQTTRIYGSCFERTVLSQLNIYVNSFAQALIWTPATTHLLEPRQQIKPRFKITFFECVNKKSNTVFMSFNGAVSISEYKLQLRMVGCVRSGGVEEI